MTQNIMLAGTDSSYTATYVTSRAHTWGWSYRTPGAPPMHGFAPPGDGAAERMYSDPQRVYREQAPSLKCGDHLPIDLFRRHHVPVKVHRISRKSKRADFLITQDFLDQKDLVSAKAKKFISDISPDDHQFLETQLVDESGGAMAAEPYYWWNNMSWRSPCEIYDLTGPIDGEKDDPAWPGTRYIHLGRPRPPIRTDIFQERSMILEGSVFIENNCRISGSHALLVTEEFKSRYEEQALTGLVFRNPTTFQKIS